MSSVAVKGYLRKFLLRVPGGVRLLKYRAKRREWKQCEEVGSAKKIFQQYYEVNYWRNAESISGPGSTLEYTESIRRELPPLLSSLGVERVLDAPCGDYNWFKEIQWERPISYIGADIVEALIESNSRKFANATTRFDTLDVITEALPEADLWLCRDCLFHLSNDDIFLTIANFLNSDIRYLLTSSHPLCNQNTDIPTGSFRLLNLLKPPFSLPKPMATMDDWIEGYPVRYLALWDREILASHMRKNSSYQRAVSASACG